QSTALFYDLTPLRCYFNIWPDSTCRAYLARLEQLRKRMITLLAISEFTRQDVLKATGIPAERVCTITAGLNKSEEKPETGLETAKAVRQKYGITKSFFLHVGALDPHKNFEAVINSIGRARS